jgi:hypothetical protein
MGEGPLDRPAVRADDWHADHRSDEVMPMRRPVVPLRGGVSALRSLAFDLLAGVLGVVSAAFGLLSIVSALRVERTVHRLHDLGPGIVLAVVMAPAAFALLGARKRSIAGLQQAAAVVIAWTIAGALSRTFDPLFGMFLVLTVLLAVLHPARGRLLALPRRPSLVMGLIAVAAAVPLILYAANQAGLQRWTVQSNPHAAEAHYAGMAEMALAFVLVAFVGASRTDGWRLPAWCAGLAAAAFGAASVGTPYVEGSFGTSGGVIAILGGIAFIAAAAVQSRREGRSRRVSGASERALDQVV